MKQVNILLSRSTVTPSGSHHMDDVIAVELSSTSVATLTSLNVTIVFYIFV
jgi:hypothetical protein